LKIIRGRVDLNSKVYTDKFTAEFARGKNHINGIESFWGYCKMRLTKFHGLKSEDFYLYLKESEFRFNNRNENLYKILIPIVKEF
jgi:transposase-like protein